MCATTFANSPERTPQVVRLAFKPPRQAGHSIKLITFNLPVRLANEDNKQMSIANGRVY